MGHGHAILFGLILAFLPFSAYAAGSLTLISSIQLQNATQYRVLGAPDACVRSSPAGPTLEDGL